MSFANTKTNMKVFGQIVGVSKFGEVVINFFLESTLIAI